jgi:hypothetical protein
MIGARMISAQYPKNTRTTVQNIKKRLSSFEAGGRLGVFLVYQTTNLCTCLCDLTIIFHVWYNQNEVQSLWFMNIEAPTLIFYFECMTNIFPWGIIKMV